MKRFRITALVLCVGLLSFLSFGCSDDDETNIINRYYSKVRVIHASYDAPAVDVRVDGDVVIEDLEFGESSGFASLLSGTYDFGVTPANLATPVVIALNGLTLFPGEEITLFAMNELASIQPIFAVDSRYTLGGKARVRFVHASPDAPAVDIRVGDGTGPQVFSDAGFTDVSEYVEVDPGSYVFVVTAAGDTSPVVTYQAAELEAETVYTVVALGTLDSEDDADFIVRVYIDNDDGDQFVDLVPEIDGM